MLTTKSALCLLLSRWWSKHRKHNDDQFRVPTNIHIHIYQLFVFRFGCRSSLFPMVKFKMSLLWFRKPTVWRRRKSRDLSDRFNGNICIMTWAIHRADYFSNMACDWLSIVWAYLEQETENWPWCHKYKINAFWLVFYFWITLFGKSIALSKITMQMSCINSIAQNDTCCLILVLKINVISNWKLLRFCGRVKTFITLKY